MRSRSRLWYTALVIPVTVFVVDRITKALFFNQPEIIQSVIPGVLWFQLHLNTAMAFSLPLWPWVYYPAIFAAFIGLLVACVKALQQTKLVEFICTLTIVVAAISNLLDRVYYGGVIDFIALPTGGIFNLADVAIVCSVLIWAVTLWKYDRK